MDMGIQVIPDILGEQISLNQEVYLSPNVMLTVDITLTPSSWAKLIEVIETSIKHPERGASAAYAIQGVNLEEEKLPPGMN